MISGGQHKLRTLLGVQEDRQALKMFFAQTTVTHRNKGFQGVMVRADTKVKIWGKRPWIGLGVRGFRNTLRIAASHLGVSQPSSSTSKRTISVRGFHARVSKKSVLSGGLPDPPPRTNLGAQMCVSNAWLKAHRWKRFARKGLCSLAFKRRLGTHLGTQVGPERGVRQPPAQDTLNWHACMVNPLTDFFSMLTRRVGKLPSAQTNTPYP